MTDHTKPEPGSRWAFDRAVTDVFDDMLRRSIPDYSTMRKIVTEVGSRFVVPWTTVTYLGCSRGQDMAPFVKDFRTVFHLGLEISEPMLDAARERFADSISAGIVEIRQHDLRLDPYPSDPASLTLAVLTIQFTPVEYRARILRDVYQATEPGGALIVVEKVLGESADTQDLLVELYHAEKMRNGYTDEEIEAKARSLEGVLVGMTAKENERSLRAAGFVTVECVWRAYNFAAWLAVKPKR